MRFTHFIKERLATEKTTPAVRLIAIIFAAFCTIPAILCVIYFPVLVVAAPGVILTVFYWRIARDISSHREAELVWAWTMMYNLALALGFAASLDGNILNPTVPFQILGTGIAGIGLFLLNEKNKEENRKYEVLNTEEAEQQHATV